jgi:hypothetical protein
MDFPINFLEPCVIIHPWSLESIGPILQASNSTGFGATASATFPTANKALFFPFFLSKSITALQFLWYNGTVVSGNIDVGIYTEDGTRLYALGSTPQTGTSIIQSIGLLSPGLTFGPGLFYLAITMDNTTGTLFRGKAHASLTQVMSELGAAEMAAAFSLPATATLTSLTVDYIPVFGLSVRNLV